MGRQINLGNHYYTWIVPVCLHYISIFDTNVKWPHLRGHYNKPKFYWNHKKYNHRLGETEKDFDNAFDANLMLVDALCLITITELLTVL